MLYLPVEVAAIVALAPAAYALTPLETFYPPTLNSTSYITDSSLGSYGGVYNAATRSSQTKAPYGVYDYCSMPHPRSTEYTLPAAIANGSMTGSIVYLEYMQRHQRRTPYNILPGGEVRRFLGSPSLCSFSRRS